MIYKYAIQLRVKAQLVQLSEHGIRNQLTSQHQRCHAVASNGMIFVKSVGSVYLLHSCCCLFPGEVRPPSNHGGSAYNGDSQVLYWADASSEIAFVIPTQCCEHDVSPQFDSSSESTHVSGQGNISVFNLLLW
jgi:hypothetical protein